MNKSGAYLLIGIGAVALLYYLYSKQSAASPVIAGGQTTPGTGAAPSNTAGQTVTTAASNAVTSTQYVGSDATGDDGGDYASYPGSELGSLYMPPASGAAADSIAA